jgi:hypothetical protein
LSCISPTVGTKFISPAEGWSPYLRVDAAKVCRRRVKTDHLAAVEF